MGHNISGLILKYNYDQAVAAEYDLQETYLCGMTEKTCDWYVPAARNKYTDLFKNAILKATNQCTSRYRAHHDQ